MNIDKAIKLLNEALKLDRKAIEELINHRVKCNRELAIHDTIQCGLAEDKEYKYEVGILGIINGIFGKNDKGVGHISAMVEDGKIIKFEKID